MNAAQVGVIAGRVAGKVLEGLVITVGTMVLVGATIDAAVWAGDKIRGKKPWHRARGTKPADAGRDRVTLATDVSAEAAREKAEARLAVQKKIAAFERDPAWSKLGLVYQCGEDRVIVLNKYGTRAVTFEVYPGFCVAEWSVPSGLSNDEFWAIDAIQKKHLQG